MSISGILTSPLNELMNYIKRNFSRRTKIVLASPFLLQKTAQVLTNDVLKDFAFSAVNDLSMILFGHRMGEVIACKGAV